MSYNKPIRRIAIVGTGVIGASWSAQYLARGFDVVATDPAPNAEANLRKYVDEAWKDLTNIGLSEGASRDRLAFTPTMKDALSKADFVQENGPERPDFKMKLFADLDEAAPIDSIIASSSSGITPSVMQSKSKHPERILVGHAFNPPHIIPLVEVVGGAKTSPEAIKQALTFYAVDWEETDPFEEGTSRSRREPAAGGALQGDHVSDSARCAERRGCGHGRELWPWIALGSDGAEFAMASRRRRRRHQTFHGPSHGSVGGDDQNSGYARRYAGAEANDCRRSPARSGESFSGCARTGRERTAHRPVAFTRTIGKPDDNGKDHTRRVIIDDELDL